MDEDDDIHEYELNGNDDSGNNCINNGIIGKSVLLNDSTEKMIWKQVVNEKMVRNEWIRREKNRMQLKGKDEDEDDDDDKGAENVYHVKQEETSENHHEEKTNSYSSSSRNSITSSTSSTIPSISSSSTPTLIKYRKLSQRPKDQPPPP